jgi:Fur family peroxide stress response transcriptional regulator
LRFSHQRNIIHQSIKDVSCHPTAQEIFAMVRVEIPNISLGTIYRNLSQLLEHKLIREIQIDGISHYDGTITDHHHFHCTKCHSIQDCDIPDSELMNEVLQTYGGTIEKCEIIFSGICKSCNQYIS